MISKYFSILERFPEDGLWHKALLINTLSVDHKIIIPQLAADLHQRSLLVEEGNDGCPADEWSEILIIIALHIDGILRHAHTCREDLCRR